MNKTQLKTASKYIFVLSASDALIELSSLLLEGPKNSVETSLCSRFAASSWHLKRLHCFREIESDIRFQTNLHQEY